MRPKSFANALHRPDRSEEILKLTNSAQRGELVAIIGTGVSISLTNGKIPALSWRGLVRRKRRLGRRSSTQALLEFDLAALVRKNNLHRLSRPPLAQLHHRMARGKNQNLNFNPSCRSRDSAAPPITPKVDVP
jgi:hypothetical protein